MTAPLRALTAIPPSHQPAQAAPLRPQRQTVQETEAGPAVPRVATSLASLPARPLPPSSPRAQARRVGASATPARPQRLCTECVTEEDDKQSGQGTSVRPSLEVGSADDAFEREADTIAAQTLAAPAVPALSPTSTTADHAVATGLSAASPHALRIRRACASCGSEDESVRALRVEDSLGLPAGGSDVTAADEGVQRKCATCAAEEEKETARRRGTDTAVVAAPRLASSPGALTQGGRPLPETTRDFFETRMGHDLSGVRVHDGEQSERLNHGIDAHAFTYGSHVWLGRGEKADTGFTMAHELAHVLQQTQPGPARARRNGGAEATPAGARVQRLSGRSLKAFWMPSTHTGGGTGSRKINEATHDLAMEALAGASSNIILDAPVPGATGGQKNQCNTSGFADFFQSDQGSTVGVIKECGVQTPDPAKSQVFLPKGSTVPPRAPSKTQIYHDVPPIKDFPAPLQRRVPKWVTVKPRQPMLGGRPYDHGANRGPTIDAAGELQDFAKAPKNIKIGDMKPGHNITEREAGVTQINNYIDTISNIALLVDGYQRGRGETETWGLGGSRSTMKLTSLGKIPADWDPNATTSSTLTRETNIKLYRSGSPVPVKPPGGAGATPQINGRWVIAQDLKNTGIFTYFLVPDKADLDAALKDPGVDANFSKVSTSLRDNVFKDLLTTPGAPAPKPRRRGGVRRLATSRTPWRVRRNGPKGAAKPKPKDPFDYAKWHQKRYGKSKDDLTSFRGVFNKEFKKDKISFGKASATPEQIVEFQSDIVQSLMAMNDHFGVKQTIPNFDRAKTQTTTYRQFEFWASKPAAIMGRLRQIFGRAFIKVWSLAERAKRWVNEKIKKFKFKGTKAARGLKGVAMKVGAQILKRVGEIMLGKTAQALVTCVEAGFKRTMEELVQGPFEQLEEKFQEIETFVHQAEQKLIGQLETMFEDIIGPIRKDLEKLAGDLKFIGEIVGVIKNSIDLVRLGICVAGGIESFGISCAVAAMDKVLSLMDISPTDKIAGAIMQSCEAQEILAEFVAASTFMQSIPNRIAKEIMGRVRKTLPPSLQGFICKDEDFKITDFDPKEMECKPGKGDGGGDGSVGTGGKAGDEGDKGGGGKAGGNQTGGTGTTGGSGSSGNSGGGLPVTTPKPIPANLKFPKKQVIPVILTEGMPTEDTLVPGKIVKVTMVMLKKTKGGYEPAVVVREVELKFYSVAEEPTENGFIIYEIDVVKDFYVEEIGQVVYATNDTKKRPRVSGLP